jgi:hypothetical protein
MQTILGAGGVIGAELTTILPQYIDEIRLVRRNVGAVATDGATSAAGSADEKAGNHAAKLDWVAADLLDIE